MIKKIKALVLFFLLTGLIVGISKVSSGFGGAVNIQTMVIEGFEEKDGWEAKYSKFRCRNWNNEDKEKPDESKSWITWVESNGEDGLLPDGLPKELRGKQEKTTMGVKGCFDVKGYNWIVLEPKKPLISKGITKAIDLWVWGSGYNYDLYIVIKTWQGTYYSLYMGNLSYYGWQNLRVEIPEYISQFTSYVPRIKPIQVVRLKLVSKPDEKPDDFYAYFDYMQIQTDIYEERYNGDNLNNNRW
ncbi:MAG: hypothetical protein A2Y41_11965 [Spirochaetes bacterium GWB1_36_13]|nr:MAG: hypothetical protein A2Y41_11965 [Spirochaetes bacterium GWB1_36_13]